MRNSKRIQARKLFSGNIVLIGFMGAGKSSVSEYMSTMLAMKMIDMDQEIAEREGMSIPDIFATYGEEYFRGQETRLLEELEMHKNVIISCGGGAALREENMMEKRRERYEGAADIVIQTDDKSILQVCEELISRLMELGGE